MEFESQLALMSARITRLENENIRLKAEKSRIIERVVEITPTDYDSLKEKLLFSSKQVEVLNQHCLALEHLILFNDGSPSAHIIHDFKAITQLYLIQLAKEIEIYRFCEDERSNLIDFLEYLRSVTQEIEDMIFIER